MFHLVGCQYSQSDTELGDWLTSHYTSMSALPKQFQMRWN
jgi:hypothetical protein